MMFFPRWNLTLLLLVLFSISLSSTVLHATTFVPIPLSSQVAESDTIVRGKIGTSYSDYGSRNDGGRGIYTFYHLLVTEVIKGDVAPSSSALIREMGGEKDGIGMQVAGSAHFDPGEDVVVFMGSRNPDGSYELKGLSSGKYNIRTEDDGTESLLGLVQHETMKSLRSIVQNQQGRPAHVITPSPSTSLAMSKSSHSAAPQLQPSTTPPSDEEGKPSAKTSVWFFVIAAFLLGWYGLRKLRKK